MLTLDLSSDTELEMNELMERMSTLEGENAIIKDKFAILEAENADMKSGLDKVKSDIELLTKRLKRAPEAFTTWEVHQSGNSKREVNEL